MAKNEAEKSSTHEVLSKINVHTHNNIKRLSDEIIDLKVRNVLFCTCCGLLMADFFQAQLPSAAEKIELEARVSGEAEVKWKTAIAETQENLEASKLTIQNLLQENLCLKTNIQYITAESEKKLDEVQLKLTKTVINDHFSTQITTTRSIATFLAGGIFKSHVAWSSVLS